MRVMAARKAKSRCKTVIHLGIVYPVATERTEHNVRNIKPAQTMKRNGPSGRGYPAGLLANFMVVPSKVNAHRG